jgi:hypothetical protein
MSKFVATGPSSYKKRIYRAAVSQRLRNTALEINTEILIDASKEVGLEQASATYGTRAKRGTWNDFQWHAE